MVYYVLLGHPFPTGRPSSRPPALLSVSEDKLALQAFGETLRDPKNPTFYVYEGREYFCVEIAGPIPKVGTGSMAYSGTDDSMESWLALRQFRLAFGENATLLDACLGLRMACNGSADGISDEDKAKAVAALRARLATWRPSVVPYAERFDAAVRELVEATIAEVES